MNVEYINPFIQGAQNTINTVCGEKPALGAVKVKSLPYSSEPIAITIEFFGSVSGYGIYGMGEPLARYIASKMMMGMPVESFNDIAKSAVSELGNMISGNVATMIASKGATVDIKPPILDAGTVPGAVSKVLPEEKLISVPLSFASGDVFTIDILIRG
ncbi:MAG: chemotaxis protein CheX [Defluviitaleaceae bacterium]|nr:chemotaxis protein CheX [Defluviitaleaceae bacterium]